MATPKKPVNFSDLQRSINSPWKGIGRDLNSVTNVYLPEPNISLPQISESVYARFARDAQERTNARASFDDVIYKAKTPASLLYKAGIISEPSVAGTFTHSNLSRELRDRLTHDDDTIDNRSSYNDILDTNADIESMGGQSVNQPPGLWNRIVDVLSRFEYAGATNQHENTSKNSLDFIEAQALGIQFHKDLFAEGLMQNQSSEQIEWDANQARLEDYQGQLTDIREREGVDSTSYQSLLQVVKAWKESVEIEHGTRGTTYHPMVNPTGSTNTSPYHPMVNPGGSQEASYFDSKRPEGEYEAMYEDPNGRFAQLNRARMKGKLDIDIVPSVIPTSREEFESWKKGFTGKSKRTYTQNYMEDKGYSPGEAAFAGIYTSIISDPTTYITGGFGTVGKGAKFLKFGGTATDAIKIKTGEQAIDLFKNLDVMLSGEKLSIGGKVFTFGKGDLKGFEDVITGGVRSGRQMSKGRIGKQQVKIITEINAKLSKAVDVKYSSLGKELDDLGRSIRTSQDPIIIEQSFITLANKAASLNLDKAVADTIETLMRQGDSFKNVPLPVPKAEPVDWLDDVSELSDEAVQASTEATTASRMARLGYTTKQAAMHAEAAASKISKGTRKLAKGTPRPPVAPKVMTYTSYAGMKGKQIVSETLRLAKANDPKIMRIFEDYMEYLKTHGASKVITAEDLATAVTLQANKLVAPEVRAMMELFDIGAVDINSALGKMFKAMGYSDEQTFRALSKYKSELADGFAKNGDNFYSAKTRLVDTDLDWSGVAAARKNNATLIEDAAAIVKGQSLVVADNIAEAMAETSLRIAQNSGIKNSLELRVLGIPVVHLQNPAMVNKMMDTFMAGDSILANSFKRIKARNLKYFGGFSSLDAELNLARTRTIGQGEQIIHSLLGYVHKSWGKVSRKRHEEILDHWIAGADPQVLENFAPQLVTLDETFNAVQAYSVGITRTVGDVADVSVDQLADALNPFLTKTFQLDKKVLAKTVENSKEEFLSAGWWKDYYRKSFAMGKRGQSVTSAKTSGLDLMWSMRVAAEKAIAKSNLVDQVEHLWGLHKGAAQIDPAAWKVLNGGAEGWKPMPSIPGGITFNDEILFPAEIRDEVVKLFKLIDGSSAEEMGLGGITNASTMWKALVTVYNVPAYTVRNAVSDYIMMGFSGVTPSALSVGPKILAETKLYRNLLRENPEFARAFTMADTNNAASMRDALKLADKAYDHPSTSHVIRFGKGYKGENGERITGLTSVEILKRYYEYGLETNFVRTSLNTINPRSRTASRLIGENLKEVNSLAEDTRRLGLFADGLRLAEKRGIRNMDEALEFAAERTRKYLFDYSDFSNIERNVIGRIVPFYKWTRKAVPLMVEMLFLKPGKAMIVPRMQYAVSTSQGQAPDDVNTPGIPTADAVISSYMRLNPYMYLGDENVDGGINGIYGSISNPMAQIFSGVIDPVVWGDSTGDPNASLEEESWAYLRRGLQMPMAMVGPEIRAPFEMATGSQAFGGNELGGRPVDDPLAYLTSMFPQATLTMNLKEGGVPNSPLEIADMLGAINVQHNTPEKQASEMFLIKQLADSRKKQLEAAKDERYGND